MTTTENDSKDQTNKKLTYLAAATSLLLYIAACSVPKALILKNSSGILNTSSGLDLLLGGWLGIFVLQFAWYANCFYSLDILLLLLRKFKAALVVGIIGSILASHTFAWYWQKICMNEGGVGYSTLDHPELGFYLWYSSLLIPPLFSLCMLLFRRR